MLNTKTTVITALVLGAALSSFAAAMAQDHDHDHASGQGNEAVHEPGGDPYLLDSDPVSGKKLGPVQGQVVATHEGRELRFSSEETLGTFRSDPARYLAKVDADLVRLQLPFYPLETCPISGKELGGMSDPVDLVYRNRLVRLCCKGCTSKFHKDPAKFVGELDQAVIAAQGPAYPIQTCVVSGEELGGEMGEPIDYVLGNRLVRLCCKGCKKKVAADPLSYLAKLDQAAMGEHDHGEGSPDHESDHGHHVDSQR